MGSREPRVQQRILEQERDSSISEVLSALTSMRSEQAELTAKIAELIEVQNATTEAVRLIANAAPNGAASPAASATDLVARVDELTQLVRSKATVTVDTAQLADHLVGPVGRSIDERVAQTELKVGQLLDHHVAQMDQLGGSQASDVLAQLRTATAALDRAEASAGQLRRSLTWHGVGRVAQAMVPFAVVAVVLGGLAHTYTWAIGVGPLFAWAWASFAAATDWWTKLGIAAATLAVAGGLTWLVVRAGHWLMDRYRGW